MGDNDSVGCKYKLRKQFLEMYHIISNSHKSRVSH